MDCRKIYYSVQGGLGMNCAFSSFISYVKKELPGQFEFNVLSPYYDIYTANPAVDFVYKGHEYSDMIKDCEYNEGELYVARIYDTQDFIFKKDNYQTAWLKQLKIDLPLPERMTIQSELEPFKKYPSLEQMADGLLSLVKEKGFEDFAIMQFTGGQSPLVQVPPKRDQNGNTLPEPDWNAVKYPDEEPLKRRYPLEYQQQFVDIYHKKYPKTACLIYHLPNEPSPDGDFIFRSTIPYLTYFELAKKAVDVVCIDSSLQHLIAHPDRPATVIWAHSLPENFGYSFNNNVIQKCRRDDIRYFTALGACNARVDYIPPEELLEIVSENRKLREEKRNA